MLADVVRDNPSLRGYVLDVTDEGQARTTLDNLVRNLGALDVLVNSAGTRAGRSGARL